MVYFCFRLSNGDCDEVKNKALKMFLPKIILIFFFRRWSDLYFIVWYFFVTTIGLNLCLALSGEVNPSQNVSQRFFYQSNCSRFTMQRKNEPMTVKNWSFPICSTFIGKIFRRKLKTCPFSFWTLLKSLFLDPN